jgi:heme-degrading monooxygenase HmoA
MKNVKMAVLSMSIIFASWTADAQTVSSQGMVITMTRLSIPWYAPKFVVKSKMKDSIPEYSGIPGLNRKIYSIESDTGLFGGIYLWENQKSANDWFTPAWFERVNKKYGGDNKVPILPAIFIHGKDTSKSTSLNENWASVKSFAVGTDSISKLPKYFESKISNLEKKTGYLGLWVADESANRIKIITLWSDEDSMNSVDLSELVSQNWKEEESIQTKVPIVITNK